ncbi:hypothetical protein G9P44_000667 [Scheffersomyces stipitis]|nr:hypothetical protein G9P44_000667 [Scheffersomyces stipitis]
MVRRTRGAKRNKSVDSSDNDDSLSDASDEEIVTSNTPASNLDNDQKTHYFVTINSKNRNGNSSSMLGSFFETLNPFKKRKTAPAEDSIPKTPFLQLFNGQEPPEAVAKRYQLFVDTWKPQLEQIESELNQANNALFSNLLKFIDESGAKSRLPTAYVQLTTNSANNLRIMQDFNNYLKLQPKFNNTTVINLMSKNCYNIKSTFREIIKQFLEANSSDFLQDSDVEEKEDEEFNIQGRVNYDFDIVRDYCISNIKDLKSFHILIIIQDTNSMSNHVLNQLIRILHSYCTELPIHLVLGLSSENVGKWISGNLSNESRIIVDGNKFSSNDNIDFGFELLDKLFLNPHGMSLILHPQLTTIILNRFKYSNNSIDALIAEIKLVYMIHFYQQPLSLLLSVAPSEISSLGPVHLQRLRKLPSFKKHIELNLASKSFNYSFFKSLLTDDAVLVQEFEKASINFGEYQKTVLNAIDIVSYLQKFGHNQSLTKHKFDLYNMIANNKFVHSVYLNELLKSISKSSELQTKVTNKFLLPISSQYQGQYETKLLLDLSVQKAPEDIIAAFRNYFKNPLLQKPIEEMLFNEVFTMNGGTITQVPEPLFEENYENLMINLIRPNLRSTLEHGLENSNPYLSNPLIVDSESSQKGTLNPTLTYLFKVYKEAPVNISIYDFYIAFKSSLDRNKIKELLEKEDEVDIDVDEVWEKLTYSWFTQNCFELMMMGLLKEKPKGDHLEKAIWKGV